MRPITGVGRKSEALEGNAARKVTVGCLVAFASITGAKAQQPAAPPAADAGSGAQQEPLPPVTVEAPTARKRAATPRPSKEQLRARNALRRAARARQRAAQARPQAPAPSAAPQAPDQSPYADPAAPYKGDRLASPKFSEPIVNTPRSVTVLTKEILKDKEATSLKDVARTTAGVTLGTGEGGNAFGDRFFIRGFDARNDVFIDGIRDPAVNVRENFFTEQIELLKGPSSTVDGRGTTGGALNIITKQAMDHDFYDSEGTLASDGTRRVTFDVNQVINPTLAFRADGLWQNAGVAGRDLTTDDRWGGLLAMKWTPTDAIKVTANYIHTDLWGLPDFGVPYDTAAKLPVTSAGVPRDTYYGFVNRDFQDARQDIGTINAEVRLNDFVTLSDTFRAEQSLLNYIGTIPEQGTGANGSCNSLGGNFSDPNPANWLVCLNPQSRYQLTNVLANQTAAKIKFDTGPVRHTVVAGVEASQERVSLDSYNGLSSEDVGVGAFANGSIGPVSILSPPNFLAFGTTPTPTGNPDVIPVDTKSVYALETANWRDFIILNGGVRFDDYAISASKIGFPTVSDHSDSWNYNFGIVVKPVPIASLYASYGTGSEPVGAELDGTSANYGGLSPNSPITQIFGPTQSKAAEVGTKWELFDRHLLATAALFRTDVSNARELVPAGYPNAGTIQAGAAYHVQGIDLGAEGKITSRWSVYAGLVLMNTRVDQSSVPTNIGLPLAFVANQSFNVLTKYRLTDTLEVGGEATYRSKIYGGTLLAANAGTVLPSYWRFDAFVHGDIDKNWRWKLFANNIFDRTYYDAFYQSGAPFTLVAPGRTVGLEMAAKF